MLHLRYWKYSYQFTLCSSDQHKFNKTEKVAQGSSRKSEKNEAFLTLTDTLIQKRYKCKLTAPFALLPPAFPHNPILFLPEARTVLHRLCQNRLQSRNWQPNTLPAYVPTSFWQHPTLKLDYVEHELYSQVWWQSNSDNPSLIDFHQNYLGYFRQLRSQSLLTQLILIEMDYTVPEWADPPTDGRGTGNSNSQMQQSLLLQ